MADSAETAVPVSLRGLIGDRLGIITRNGDVALALAIVAVLVVLILPMPAWMLDICLAISFTFSVLILMTALFIERPLEFNAFPTVLLLATMVRLALNLASTRLILTYGHEGPAAAGHVIEAFGGFVMGGNFVIGIIVFTILVIVNFIVITKGSGRIAEVSARFSLDAMPGKQMAIDADLSAGMITEDQARARRKAVEDESAFYGSMDGASKFVRGDAVAGLMITVINVIAGMVIGVGQRGMPAMQAAETFTLLTVGDGLVSQIPALLVSTAAGIVVTKASLSERTEKALSMQLGGQPKVLGTSAFLLAALALLPGIPPLPFIAMAIVIGGLAWYVYKRANLDKAAARSAEEEDAAASEPPAEEPIQKVLRLDELRLELGYALLALVNATFDGPKLTDQIKALRRQFALELGFVMPSVRIQDNMQLGADHYVIRVKELEAGHGEIRAACLLVMDPRGGEIEIQGETTQEPTFGLPAKWIDGDRREEATFRGYTVVDPTTVITTHLTEVIKDNMAELLSYAETRKLLDELDAEHQKLVTELIPNQISYAGIQRVLQSLLAERISIRDLATILEGIAEASSHTRSALMITEHVRSRLARQISDMHTNDQGIIPLVTLSPDWERSFADAFVGTGEDRQLALPPSRLHEFVQALRNTFERQALAGETPVLLTSPALRPYVRSILERFRPSATVLSQNEIAPRARVRTVGQI